MSTAFEELDSLARLYRHKVHSEVCTCKACKEFLRGVVVAEDLHANSVRNFPTRDDCRIVEAIMKAAKQIHAEFDCFSDHVQTKKQILEQISTIIWRHLDKARLSAAAHQTGEGTK